MRAPSGAARFILGKGAWLVWSLDQAADGRIFKPAIEVAWLEEGRQHRDKLPWIRESAAFAARPQCMLSREWARITFKTLAEQLTKVEDDAPVVFHFDGEVLTIRCAGKITAVAAQGNRWSEAHSIPARSLQNLPKRFMEPQIEGSIWNSALGIGRRQYLGVAPVDVGRTPSREPCN